MLQIPSAVLFQHQQQGAPFHYVYISIFFRHVIILQRRALRGIMYQSRRQRSILSTFLHIIKMFQFQGPRVLFSKRVQAACVVLACFTIIFTLFRVAGRPVNINIINNLPFASPPPEPYQRSKYCATLTSKLAC
jgi:hypothetical protein